MMNSLQAKFGAVLQNELVQLSQLEVVLGQEHVALNQRDSDALVLNSKEKQRLITSIEALGRERLGLLNGAGQGQDKEAILAFVESAPQLRRQWDELEAVLIRCQKQNQVNGMLLEKGKKQTQQLLGILLGETNRKDTELYNAKGGTSPSFLNGRSVKV
jgi:flagellar biosynthesis/type III secretory pathway chaperone